MNQVWPPARKLEKLKSLWN